MSYKYQRKMIACIRCKMVRWKNNNLMSIFFLAVLLNTGIAIYVCIKVFSFCYSTELENIKNRQSILNTRVSLYLIFLGMQAVISLHFWYSVKKQMLWAGNKDILNLIGKLNILLKSCFLRIHQNQNTLWITQLKKHFYMNNLCIFNPLGDG